MSIYNKYGAKSNEIQLGLHYSNKPSKVNPFLTKVDPGQYNPLAQTTIDITGLTTLDLSTYTQYGIIILTSSNAAETLDDIIGIANTNTYVLRPETGLTVTLRDKTVSGSGNLKLAAPTIDVIGTNEGYIGLQKRYVSGDLYQVEYLDMYI